MNNLEKPHFSGLDSVLFLTLVLVFGALLTQLLMIGNEQGADLSTATDAPKTGRFVFIQNMQKAAVQDGMNPLYKNSSQNRTYARKTNFFSLKALSELKLTAPTIKNITHKPIVPNPLKSPFSNPILAPTPILVPQPQSQQQSFLQPKPQLELQPQVDILGMLNPKNTNTAAAVVNILCSITEGRTVRHISSSGVLISDTGLILTNAHVGIHPFMAAYGKSESAKSGTGNGINNTPGTKPISCKIRSGSPASLSFGLDFIYISPIWTGRHPGETNGILKSDTGESDLAILKAIRPEDLKKYVPVAKIKNIDSINPFIIFATDTGKQSLFSGNLSIGQSVKVIAYPISGSDPANLRKEEAALSITDLFGFLGNGQELIETSASTIGKSGASGGALTDSDGNLIGILANVITTEDPNRAKIRAISLDHINAYLKSQTGITLESLIKTDGASLKGIFESRYLGQVKTDLLD